MMINHRCKSTREGPEQVPVRVCVCVCVCVCACVCRWRVFSCTAVLSACSEPLYQTHENLQTNPGFTPLTQALFSPDVRDAPPPRCLDSACTYSLASGGGTS